MTRWAKLGDVLSDHMWEQPALWSRRSHCSCGWTGGADESWIGHVATQLDSVLEQEDATACAVADVSDDGASAVESVLAQWDREAGEGRHWRTLAGEIRDALDLGPTAREGICDGCGGKLPRHRKGCLRYLRRGGTFDPTGVPLVGGGCP